MRLEAGKENIMDLRMKSHAPVKKTLTFDSLRDKLFRPRGKVISQGFIVRPRFDENGQVDYVDVCGEIIYQASQDGVTLVGLEMYYDDLRKAIGFNDAVKVGPLPEHYKGCEVDRGIGQIMYQNAKEFSRFGFPNLKKENDNVFLDISWRTHFKNAGYQIINTVRPLLIKGK